VLAAPGTGHQQDTPQSRLGTLGVTRHHQAPTLAGSSHHSRYRHAKTHRHANGMAILTVWDRRGLGGRDLRSTALAARIEVVTIGSSWTNALDWSVLDDTAMR
jgi:hypothetical protein